MVFPQRFPLAILLAFFLGGLFGCRQADQPPNVVLIVIDTLRADRLAAYGGDPKVAPFLNHLAQTGTVCTQAYSASSWTAPAMASMMTALHPLQHGVETGFVASMRDKAEEQTIALDRVPEDLETLAESLQQGGYRTFAVTDNRNICREMGFDQGFDRFHGMNYEGAKAVQSQVMEWESELRQEDPYFLYLHFMDPHRPYVQHDPNYVPVGRLRDDQLAAYDSEVDYVDRTIQRLYETFGWDQNTVVVVTSDHGEEFLEHGGWDHGRTLYQEVLAVPLFWVWPGGGAPYDAKSQTPVAELADPTSVMDIAPTLREYLHLPAARAQGMSLLPALQGHTALPERLISAHVHTPPWFGDRVLHAVLDGSRKLIHTEPDQWQWFDLRSDPGEQQDLSSQSARPVVELWERYERAQERWFRAEPASVEVTLDAAQVQRLKTIGYAE